MANLLHLTGLLHLLAIHIRIIRRVHVSTFVRHFLGHRCVQPLEHLRRISDGHVRIVLSVGRLVVLDLLGSIVLIAHIQVEASGTAS